MQFKHVQPCEGYRTSRVTCIPSDSLEAHSWEVQFYSPFQTLLLQDSFYQLIYYDTTQLSFHRRWYEVREQSRSDNLIRIYGGGSREWSVPSF